MNKVTPTLLAVSIATLFSACGGGDGKKTNSLTASIPQSRVLSGVAQKGPAIKGGLIHLYELDNHAHRTGKKLLSIITGNQGDFSLSLPDNWGQFVEVVFNGRYINEATGEISAPVQLNAIQDSKSSKQVSVNILTTIATARVKSLPKNMANYSLATTLHTAYNLLEKITGISAQEIPYLNLLGSGDQQARASMLLLSGALLEVAAQQNTSVQRVIDQLAIDFALDGVFDGRGDEWLRAIQALVHNIEGGYVAKYSRVLRRVQLTDDPLPQEDNLPKIVVFSARPTAVASVVKVKSICADDVIPLLGEGSKDSNSGSNIRYSWFQTDQTGLLVDLNSRFTKDASFVAPDVTQATTLFFTLLVVDEQRDEQGNALDITDVSTVEIVVQPKESELCRDEPIPEEVIEEAVPIIFIPPSLPPLPSVPTASDFLESVERGKLITVDVTTGIFDPLGQGVDFSIVNGPSNSDGNTSISPSGVISYQHDGGSTTTDALVYKIQDQSSPPRVATAEVRFNITAPATPNTAPVMVMKVNGADIPLGDSLSRSFDENATGIVFDIDSIDDNDAEGSGLVYSFDGGEDDGLFSLSSNGELSFVSSPDFESGEDASNDSPYKTKVKVTDSGGLSDIVDISVEVNDVNEAPVAVDDSILPGSDDFVSPGSAEPEGSLRIERNVLHNDYDPDYDDELTVSLVHDVAFGTLVLNTNGTFTYTSSLSEFNANVTFIYKVTDREGLTSEALVTIHAGNQSG